MAEITLTEAQLKNLLKEAGEEAIEAWVRRVGLDPESASKDMGEMLDFIRAFRSARQEFWKQVISWISRVAFWSMLVGGMYLLGLQKLIKLPSP